MDIESKKVEINFLEIERNEAIKCGEIISFDYLEFWYSCSFCQKQIPINSLEFIKHIQDEFGKDCQEYHSTTNAINFDENPIDDNTGTEIVKAELEYNESNAECETEWNYLTDSTKLMTPEPSSDKIDLTETSSEKEEHEIIIKIERAETEERIDEKFVQSKPNINKLKSSQDIYRNENDFSNYENENDLHSVAAKIIFGYCNKCGKSFKSKRGYSAHNCMRMFAKKNLTDATGQYACNLCDGKFAKAFQLRMHKINSHSGDLTCEICGKIFATKRYYDAHKQDVHTNVTYTCDQCDRIFKKRSLLKDHVMRDHLKKYQCSICSKTFVSITQVRAHETIHGAKKEFQCDECGKSFPRFFQLGLHKKSHANLREYQCDICNKRCNTDRGLRNHKQWHTDSRDFVCQICFKTFKTSGCLRKHKRIHTPSENYKCDFCGKSFNQNCNLKVHMKSHNLTVIESA